MNVFFQGCQKAIFMIMPKVKRCRKFALLYLIHILYSANIVKGERQRSNLFETLSEPHPIFCKYSER